MRKTLDDHAYTHVHKQTNKDSRDISIQKNILKCGPYI